MSLRETMTRHLTDLELDRYRGRTLPPQQLLSANAHLHDCDYCHERYGGDRRLADAFALARSLKATGLTESHLPFEQLAAYVDGELQGADQSMAVAHLKECAECDAQVRELKPLRALITRQSYPALVPASVPVRQPSFFEKLRAAWQAPSYRIAAQVVGVVLVLALLGWVLARSFSTNDADRRTHAPQPPQEQAEIPSGSGNEGSHPEVKQGQPSLVEKSSPLPAPTKEGVPESTSTMLALEDGDGRVTLDDQGRVVGLDSLSPAYQRIVRTVLITEKIQTPRLPWEGRRSDTLMGRPADGVSFSLQNPVGKVVLTARPTLRWTPLEGATSYVVTVRDSTGGTLVTSAPLSSAEWNLQQPLRRGVTYSWKVLAMKAGEEVVSPPPTAPDAQFKVLEESQAEELERARQFHPRSHLLLGALYAKAGLLDEAEEEFRSLVEKNPHSRFAQRLLRDVRARQPF